MKITLGSLIYGMLILILLCLPAIVFVGLCACIFVVFHLILLLIDQFVPPSQVGVVVIAWLLLIILYIVLGVIFTRVFARLLLAFLKSAERRTRRRIALLSGLPFYALSLIGLLATVVCFIFPDMMNALTAFVSLVWFVGFALISGGYLLLLRFLLRRSPSVANPKNIPTSM